MDWIAASKEVTVVGPITMSSGGGVPSRTTRKRHVALPNPLSNSRQKVRIGTIVSKEFEEGIFFGEVTGYDHDEDWYKVRYSDGEEEDLNWLEIVSILPARAQQIEVGATFSKQFDEGMFVGTVDSYDAASNMYGVRYPDGDFEDLE